MKRPSRILVLLLTVVVTTSVLLGISASADPATIVTVVQTSGGFTPTDDFGRVITVKEDPLSGNWKTYVDDVETNYTGIVSNAFGDWYCKDGVVEFTYSGIVEENEEQWFIQEGKVDHGFNGTYEDGNHVYTVQEGRIISKELKESYKKSLFAIVFILAIVAAVILSSKQKKKSHKKPVETPVSNEHIVDGPYSKSGDSIPNDHFKRQEQPTNHKTVKVKVKPKVEPQPVPTPEPKPKPEPEPIKQMPYRRKHLLTKNEYAFYKSLKPIADNLGLIVLTKVRMGDLVDPLPTWNRSEWYSNWGRVKARHVDFALAKPSNMYIELLIELDDNSHKTPQAQETDQFKNDVYKYTGYKLLRVYDVNGLDERIRKKLAE